MWFNRKINPEKIKVKNTKILRRNGIEVIEHLPYLENPTFRKSKEVAKRMMTLLGLFQLHLKAPKEIIKNWIEENKLTETLTREESEFLKNDYNELTEQNQIDIYWYVETIWTFAWIGGFHNNLTFNTSVENTLVSYLPNIERNESAKSFIEGFKYRNEIEIFTMLDKFYRAHWFARNNKLKGITSDKVDLDIIMERRKALEFTCFEELIWDEISLDT